IDMGRVVETVSHRFESPRQDSGALSSEDRLYRVQLGAPGVSLTLRRRVSTSALAARESAWRRAHPSEPGHRSAERLPAQAIPLEQAPAFAIRTFRVSRGGSSVRLARGRWRSRANSAVRSLAPALSERITAREGRLEWGYRLDHALAPVGGLTIEAHIAGGGEASQTQGARPVWRFSVGAGRSVQVGAFRVKDARGRDLY